LTRSPSGPPETIPPLDQSKNHLTGTAASPTDAAVLVLNRLSGEVVSACGEIFGDEVGRRGDDRPARPPSALVALKGDSYRFKARHLTRAPAVGS